MEGDEEQMHSPTPLLSPGGGSGGKRIKCYCGYGTGFMSSMKAHVAFKHLQRPLVLCPHCPHFSKYSVLDMKKHIGSQHPWSNQDPIDKRDEAAEELDELLRLCTQETKPCMESCNGGGTSPSRNTPSSREDSPTRKKRRPCCVNDASTECACALCGVRVLGMENVSYNKLILHENSLVFCPLCPIHTKTAPVKQLNPLHIPSVPVTTAASASAVLPPKESPKKDMQTLSNLSLPPSPEPRPTVSIFLGGDSTDDRSSSPQPYRILGSPPMSPNGRAENSGALRTSICSLCHEPVRQEAAHQHAIRHLGRNLIRCPICPYSLRTSVTSMRHHIHTDHPGSQLEPINDRPAALEEIRDIKRICFGTDELHFPIDYSIKSILSPPPSLPGTLPNSNGYQEQERESSGTPNARNNHVSSAPGSRTRKMTPRDPNYTALYDTERCCLCDEDVRIPEAAHQHAIRHLGKNLIRCPHCPYSLRISVISMRAHIASEHPGSHGQPINDRVVFIDEIRDLKKQCFPKRYGKD